MSDKIEVERKTLEKLLEMGGTIKAASIIKELLNTTPTMTEADWKRVVDEGFYVKEVGRITCNNPLIPESIYSLIAGGYEVAREKGLRQPHFKGHPHPEGDTRIFVYTADYPKGVLCFARNVFWGDAKEYIIL